MKYEIVETMTGEKTIKRDNGDGTVTFIPFVEANSDYQVYLQSLDNK